jgi:hypothetical protein
LWLHDLIRGQVSGSQPVTDENLIPSLLLQKKKQNRVLFPGDHTVTVAAFVPRRIYRQTGTKAAPLKFLVAGTVLLESLDIT